jgi:hypothetical protein
LHPWAKVTFSLDCRFAEFAHSVNYGCLPNVRLHELLPTTQWIPHQLGINGNAYLPFIFFLRVGTAVDANLKTENLRRLFRLAHAARATQRVTEKRRNGTGAAIRW